MELSNRKTGRITLLRSVSALCVLGVILIACGTQPPPVQPTTTESPANLPVPPSPADATLVPPPQPEATTASVPPPSNPSAPVFTVAVIVDLQSETVERAQAEALLREASSHLEPLAGIGLLMTDFAADGAGGSTNDLASRYINAHSSALPNGLVILSRGDDDKARLQGSYGYAIGGPQGFRNAFVSPMIGSGQLYVAVVHYGHKYAPCGYGAADMPQAAMALDGECRNQPGMGCTQHNGYSMCADSVPHLYASTPTYFAASMIVHELMHPFSPGGELDHYNTPECNTRMGYPPQFFDLQESQYHNGLCPYVYQEFARSFPP